jgi:tRNA(Met) cytidine acetyltransferase
LADPAEIVNAVRSSIEGAAVRRHRLALVLTGNQQASVRLAQKVINELLLHDACWFSDVAPPAACTLRGAAALRLMGREVDALVFDAWSGFDPDAFGALTGCIRAGGLLVLLAPPLSAWPAYADPQHARITVAPYAAEQVSGRFLQRLARLISDDCSVLLCEDDRVLRLPQQRAGVPATFLEDWLPGSCKTLDQQRAVDALIKVATGHRRRPVVLISDRGRGKSAAFGIAAAQLVSQGRQQLLLTAPRTDAVDAVLEHAERELPGARSRIRYVAPDELARHPLRADLLMVDEAAAIPTPLLEQLLKHYPRIAFATTVHGYEGTGRGFSLRFSHMLDRLSNSWKSLQLTTPIRWAQGDPLERLVFRVLALDAEPADSALFAGCDRPEDFELLKLERDELVEDEQSLSELFGLLVQAHYRTRPLDLRHLLDGPNLSVYVLRAAGHIAATALVALEGGFDAAAADAIWAGRTRPHGHMLPETLAAHQGLREAPLLRCGRIMRIAVHPALQRQGLGSRLIREITTELQTAGCDYIGSSFGATPELLAFWFRLGWLPVRLSIQKGASSGTHSAVFLRAFSDAGVVLLDQARQRYFAQFPHQLSDSLYDLDPVLVAGLLQQGATHAPPLDAADQGDLRAFAREQRLAEVAIGSLWRFALRELMQGRAVQRLNEVELVILVMRVVQKRAWTVCAESTGCSGRTQALRCLREAVGKLIA